ncbi:hypothetical protein EZS27_015922 [termite gut metagenome]|uniref:Uncharacterized protein n=1 Tax=termite gut metagenome TaxID=433724 RepID=A0A5J4RRH5_9ZZZZ
MFTIAIKGKEYKLHYGLRALIIFEGITGKPFHSITEEGTTENEIILYYSIVLAANPESPLTYEYFLSALDEDYDLLLSIREWFKSVSKDLLPKTSKDTPEDKKKALQPFKYTSIWSLREGFRRITSSIRCLYMR